MKAIAAYLAVLAIAPATLAACGGDDDDESEGSAATSSTPATTTGSGDTAASVNRVDVSAPANGDLVYNPDKATARAGELTIVFDNEASVPHNLCLEDAQGKQVYGCASPVTDSGFTEPIKSIEPGTYTYYCDVDGHREAGMEGTLTVK